MVDRVRVRYKNLPILHFVFEDGLQELYARFGSVKTLNDWHVEIRLLVWLSLGFARFGLEEKDRSVLIWSLFQVDTNLMFEV